MIDGRILLGDCKDHLPSLESQSFDSLVTDPPSGIGFMGKAWDSYGSMQEFQGELSIIFKECFRLLKPGGHGLVWALPRTSHHTAVALERVGFEIRDTVLHLFGQGMPKGLDLAKAVDPSLSEQFQGWNTTLKPAHEVWWLVRKPLEGTVGENAAKYGTGGLNVDASRIGETKRVPGGLSRTAGVSYSGSVDGSLRRETGQESGHNPNIGRWPANVVVSHGDDCKICQCHPKCPVETLYESKATDFFYTPKISASERVIEKNVVNTHPTPKSVELMTYLVRMITPQGGYVLDPFAGSGTTGVAALALGMNFVGVEKDEQIHEVAIIRLAKAMEGARQDAHQNDLFELALTDN